MTRRCVCCHRYYPDSDSVEGADDLCEECVETCEVCDLPIAAGSLCDAHRGASA